MSAGHNANGYRDLRIAIKVNMVVLDDGCEYRQDSSSYRAGSAGLSGGEFVHRCSGS